MKTRRQVALSIAASACIAGGIMFAPTANAWSRIVFDPTNFVGANLANFYQLIKTLTEAKQHTQQFTEMLKNEFPLANPEVVRNSMELHRAVKEMQSAVSSLEKGFAASKHNDWNTYISNLTQRAVQGNTSAKTLMDSAYQADAQLRNAETAYRSVMRDLPQVRGVTEAAQATANAVGVVIQQNQAALGIQSALARDAAMTRAEQTAAKKHEEEAIKKFRDDADSALSAMRQMKVK